MRRSVGAASLPRTNVAQVGDTVDGQRGPLGDSQDMLSLGMPTDVAAVTV